MPSQEESPIEALSIQSYLPIIRREKIQGGHPLAPPFQKGWNPSGLPKRGEGGY